ncbi:DUF5819 family protein [Streptomyces sp. NBC_00572]|uniref:DUF5819 family protein n=1 Tax=Streptomyces sp. NBC_00572 TaxID=2903664 RepID=UPI002250B19A|nr:DUF5819 family protein [Streptomyces sp. NBC_00572]MCX4982029.1 DUF5819 family protein [Streptomyces sp. NBC_00572]
MDAHVEKDAADVADGRPTPPADASPDAPPDASADALRDPSADSPTDTPDASHAPDTAHTAGRATTGIMALSMPYQVVLAVALAVVGVFACVHLAMVFLHVAPSNTLTKRHGQAVDDWVYPEFEQNWKLFAPNPLQQNISVEVRAEVATADGSRTTGWIDLTAQDAAAIRHNPMPSHAQQNELRRAVDFYLNTHSDDHSPSGLRGRLSEEYMRRIAMLRLGDLPGDVKRVQLRTASRAVPAPKWSTEKIDTAPSYRDFPWWPVTDADRPTGADRGHTEAGR